MADGRWAAYVKGLELLADVERQTGVHGLPQDAAPAEEGNAAQMQAQLWALKQGFERQFAEMQVQAGAFYQGSNCTKPETQQGHVEALRQNGGRLETGESAETCRLGVPHASAWPLEAATAQLQGLDLQALAQDATPAELEEQDTTETWGEENARLLAEKQARTAAMEQENARVLRERQAHAEALRQKNERYLAEMQADTEARRKRNAEALAKTQAETEVRRKSNAEALAKTKAETEARRKSNAEALAKTQAETEARRKSNAEALAKTQAETEARRKSNTQSLAETHARTETLRQQNAQSLVETQAHTEVLRQTNAQSLAATQARTEALLQQNTRAAAGCPAKAGALGQQNAQAAALAQQSTWAEEARRQAHALAVTQEPARVDAERRARADAERHTLAEAERRARAEAERRQALAEAPPAQAGIPHHGALETQSPATQMGPPQIGLPLRVGAGADSTVVVSTGLTALVLRDRMWHESGNRGIADLGGDAWFVYRGGSGHELWCAGGRGVYSASGSVLTLHSRVFLVKAEDRNDTKFTMRRGGLLGRDGFRVFRGDQDVGDPYLKVVGRLSDGSLVVYRKEGGEKVAVASVARPEHDLGVRVGAGEYVLRVLPMFNIALACMVVLVVDGVQRS